MSLSAGRIAPTAAVLALAGYCVWPYAWDSAAPPGPEPRAAAVVPADRLAPDLGTPAARDPFRLPGASVAAKAAAKATAASATGGAGAAAKAVDPLAGWNLEATLIRGGTRHALINGRIYAEGEALKAAGPTPAEPVTLAGITPHAARLQCGGRSVTLDFVSDRPAKKAVAAAAPRPKPAAKKAAPAPAPHPRRTR